MPPRSRPPRPLSSFLRGFRFPECQVPGDPANRAATEPPSTQPPGIGSTLLFPGVANAPYDMPKYSAIVPTRDTTGDLEQMDMPAGSESVLEVVRVQPAAEILAEIVTEARHLLADGGRDDG
jgi:hypothetical protein